MVKNTEQGVTPGTGIEREWWQPTGSFPVEQRSGNLRAVTDEALTQQRADINKTPITIQKVAPAQNNVLPSWLTDQPTNRDLPVLRSNTGQIPSPSKEHSSVLPAVSNNGKQVSPSGEMSAVKLSASPSVPSLPTTTPAQPVQPQNVGTNWPEPPPFRPALLNPSESGLRKIRPDEALYSGVQRAVRPSTNQPDASSHLAPAEWQIPDLALASSQTGQMSPVRTPRTPEQEEEVLQSLAALKKTGPVLSPEARLMGGGVSTPTAPIPDTRLAGSGVNLAPAKSARESGPAKEAGPQSVSAPEKTARRNYPALAAALQTLGYSLPGFVASAVVGLDGTPIAQVAVDELDISPMCGHFCTIMQSVLQALEQGYWGGCEYTTVASHTRHILLRIVGNKKDVFQVLITTRETNPAESLEVMANIEAAITAALY